MVISRSASRSASVCRGWFTANAPTGRTIVCELVLQGTAFHSLPLKGGGLGWGSDGQTLTPTRRFAPTSPLQGEVSVPAARPQLCAWRAAIPSSAHPRASGGPEQQLRNPRLSPLDSRERCMGHGHAENQL